MRARPTRVLRAAARRRMMVCMVEGQLAQARRAITMGDWAGARRVFEALIDAGEGSPEVFDGLGTALWWLRETDLALRVRARAFTGLRDGGQVDDAVRVAVWLARENRVLYDNEAVASGWLAAAEECVGGATDSARGWLALARAESSLSPDVESARAAVTLARDAGDNDLEVIALARLGVAEVAAGFIEGGLRHLDQAMAVATAGTAIDPRCLGEACCALMEAAGLLGDSQHVGRWAGTVQQYLASFDYPPLKAYGTPTTTTELSTFCGACCGGIYLVTGRVDEAETELVRAIRELESTGMRSRCVHPIAQLAELRMVQGRLEEAQALLRDHEDLPEAVRPLAALDLTLGDADSATRRLRARITQLGRQPVAAFPLWALLVDAAVARRDLAEAEEAVSALRSLAELTRSRRHQGEALFARGKLATAQDDSEAPELLEQASLTFTEASVPLLAARARLLRARAIAPSDPGSAVAEGRASAAGFERLGATVDADEASAFLRSLGVKGRTGPRGLGQLTQRETEVLRLVAQGMSNQDIADRLFISVKTAGHHVSNILTKLGLRSRTEAAAFAAVHLPQQSGSK
jgi:DNA-binding NarL/FixJ family response regulator